MAIPTSILDLDTNEAMNSPAGSDNVGGTLDNFLRAHAAIIKRQFTKGADINSASTMTVPAEGSFFNVVKVVSTINAFTNNFNGRMVFLRFEAGITLIHSPSLIMPAGVSVTTQAGDIVCFVNDSPNVWRCLSYPRYTDSDHPGPQPSVTWPYMRWADTANGLLKRRNAANTGWVVEGNIGERPVKASGDTMTGSLTVPGSLYLRSGGNRHLWFYDEDGEPTGLVYQTSADHAIHIRRYVGGAVAQEWSFLTDGRFRLGTGSTAFYPDGDVRGNVWGSQSLSQVVGAKQNALGFTPVRQGGGSGMSTNNIYIGWSSASPSRLLAQVDGVPQGQIVTTNHMGSQFATQSAGAIGTYAMLHDNTGNIPVGGIRSGANLEFSGADGSSGSNPSGTWRAMGLTTPGGGAARVTLFLRIS